MRSALLPLLLLSTPGFSLAVPTSLTPAGTVVGSSQGYGSVYADAVDGNRDGHFYNGGSVWHTLIPDSAMYLEVDLGGLFYLDRIMIWPRTDAVQGTVENLKLSVLDASGAVVWQQSFLSGNSASNPWGTSALRGIRGRKVRMDRLDNAPNFLTFAELEVWGSAAQLPPNLAMGKPFTASGSAGFTTPATAGNDGDINGDYTHAGHPLFHTPASGVGQYWQVDLSNGANVDQVVDYVQLFNRTDHPSTTLAKVSLRNTSGAEVWSQTVNISRDVTVAGGRQYDLTLDIPGTVNARYCRIETTLAQYLAFGEVEVFGPPVDTIAPSLVSTDPPALELVAELNQIVVEFDEAMTGANAQDLLVNGIPATLLTPVSAAMFAFAFPQPSSGVVTFSWAPSHSIQDLAGNLFVGSGWTVTLDTSLPAPRPFISELLADNKGGVKDEDGDSPDWIEITNPGPTAVNLGGWYLTDEPIFLTKWQFPTPTILAAGKSLLVFASSKDRRIAGHELHTNFKLDPDGESLILTKPDGVTIASQILNYPPQRTNVSFGVGRSLATSPLLSSGAAVKWLVPTAALASWTARTGFDDSMWLAGATGVGFDQSGGMLGAGPLVFWNFDQATVPTAVADVTGNGNAGALTNATYSADGAGRTGQAGDRALVFAGNGAASIPTAASGAFDAITQRNALTISLWTFGAPTQPAAGFIFYAGQDSSGGGLRVLGAHLPWSDGVFYWDTAGCCDFGRHRIYIGEPDPANYRGRWNHFALVKNGDRKEIWSNGSLLHYGTNVEAMMNFRSFYLGAANSVGAGGYDGSVDDYALFDGALSESQIVALASGASPLSVRNLGPEVATPVATSMKDVNSTICLRIPFTVADPSALDILLLRIKYDDGFVAWLNGTEVARRNAPAGASPGFNAAATASRPSGAALEAEEINLSRYAALLQSGQNLLAIQGLNISASDADFLIAPELIAGSSLLNRYFALPTPEQPNAKGVAGFVADTTFTPNRGFYDSPLTVTLSCATPGAIIVYTTDGSSPTLANGTQSSSPTSVPLTTTTTLRAAAFHPADDLGPTNIDTHTYLFVDHVADQQRPAAAPEFWPGGYPGDYAMDARVSSESLPGFGLREALLSVPSLSLTLDPQRLWGVNGIYAQSTSRGEAYEASASAEWLEPDGSDGFHVNFGLRIHGNISRQKSFTPKHGFKMFFRSDYGETKLEHPLFPGSPVEKFDQLILRAGSTDTFPCAEWNAVGLGPNGALYQRWARAWASYIRDQWVRDTQIAMGQQGARGRYCHLYLNGIYWGVYNICEHPDEAFAASHLGGSPAEWDSLVDFAELQAGTATAWNQLMALAGTSASDAAFQQMMGNHPDGTRNAAFPVLLNANNLIDYMLLHVFIGADDWPNHNWWAARASRNAANDGFHFFAWDQEISNENVLYERTSWQSYPSKYADVSAASTPAQVYAALKTGSPEFRLRFADHIQRHLFHGGALSLTQNLARWNARIAEIDHAIVAESARWGDYQPNLLRPGNPYTREQDWQPHLQWMAANYWTQINATAVGRFRSAALYPAIDAPVYSQHGGEYPPAFQLQIANPNIGGGVIYFTLDGSDPRLAGGAINSSALAYSSSISLSGTVLVKSRLVQSSVWSALTEASFYPDPDLDDDGMADAWEITHGLSPGDAADAVEDADRDGQTNRQEYAADTDPHQAASVFLAHPARQTDGIHLQFTAQPNRHYILEKSEDLNQWETADIWAPQATAGPAEFVVTGAAVRKFYRITVQVP